MKGLVESKVGYSESGSAPDSFISSLIELEYLGKDILLETDMTE